MTDLKQPELKEVASFRQKAVEMFEKARVMFHTIFAGLMEHDMNSLNKVIKDEEEITEIYDNLTALAVEDARKNLSSEIKKTIVNLVDIICAIERIGDCCVSLVERIEYKIKENLLFSETAVEEYKDLHSKVEETLADTIEAVKTGDKKLARSILASRSGLDLLVDKYRANHIERAAKGVCDEWARIRYLDMLDFTKEAAHYCMEIADKVIGK